MQAAVAAWQLMTPLQLEGLVKSERHDYERKTPEKSCAS